MKITRITLWRVPLTSHEGYFMAEGKRCETVETTVLRLDTDAGLHGWGEVCPIPHYLPAYAGGVAPAVEELAPQFQVKLGASGDWQTDVERLVRVREALGDGPLVYGDWNCGTSRLDAVALKLSKFGGLGALRRARDLCLHLGARLCIEDTWGSDIATAAAVHLAAATPAKAVLNVCDLSGYVAPRLDRAAPAREGGAIRPGEAPGLGVSPDPEVLGEPVLVLD